MKIIKTLFVLVSLGAIGLCTAFAIKMPNSYKDLFNIVEKDKTTIQEVPYYVNFGDLGTSDSSYKTQYFKYANRQWYLSWGNHGQQKDHIDVNTNETRERFNMLLGWNQTKPPVYGGYSYIDEVMQNIKVGENFNYSYLIMDFDFDENHLLQFSFSPFENLTNSESQLHLISSHNLGESWSILKTINSEEMQKDNKLNFVYTEDKLISRTTRYGLVLVSNATSARIELDQFIISRLSVVK